MEDKSLFKIKKFKLTKLEKLIAGGISELIGFGIAIGLANYGEKVIREFNDYAMTFPSYTRNVIKYFK